MQGKQTLPLNHIELLYHPRRWLGSPAIKQRFLRALGQPLGNHGINIVFGIVAEHQPAMSYGKTSNVLSWELLCLIMPSV